VVVCDVSDPQAVDQLRAAVTLPVSILINNAGIGGPVAPITDVLPEEWDEVFHVNVRSKHGKQSVAEQLQSICHN
jgi:NAD(P)-dependent dehydrogenase (short-subunit alcohol dehydrogenase family)